MVDASGSRFVTLIREKKYPRLHNQGGNGDLYQSCLYRSGFAFYSGKFRIDHDTSAVFTHDHFLVKLDLHLFLRWNTVEATAAGIALDIDEAQTVTGILADALECRKYTLVIDMLLDLLGLFAQTLLILTCLAYDLLKLRALFLKHMLTVGKCLECCGDLGVCRIGHAGIFVDVLFRQLDLQCLEFHLLAQQIKLAVVAHIVKLCAVSLDLMLRIVDLFFFSK